MNWLKGLFGKKETVTLDQVLDSIPSPPPPPLKVLTTGFATQLGQASVSSQMSLMSQHVQAHQNLLNQQQGPSLIGGISGLIGSTTQQGLSASTLNNAFAPRTQTMKPEQSAWDAFLAGRKPTGELAYRFLEDQSYGGWAEPLNYVLGDLLKRVKELEDTNPWQKSYDQIADEKEAKNDA